MVKHKFNYFIRNGTVTIKHFYDKTWSVRFTNLNQIAFNSYQC